MALTRFQARRFYDRFGKLMDTQAFYEDASLDVLIAHAAFDRATTVFEFGCGTGRLAVRLLERELPLAASYVGTDLSETMVRLARHSLSPWQGRAQVIQSDGAMHIPLPDGAASHVVSTYVFDLLSENDATQGIAEAHRVLTPGGRLCLASMTWGHTLASRTLCALWEGLYRLHAPLVGGCHPISLETFLDNRKWTVDYKAVVTQFGVASEILIARPK
ncbi:MAG TPA: class I SAM-dependent methyltransferase [Gallionellaceae bacterium]|nr:class I SAM-dependent methyltransferase [Gallionellaceae bacterium]